MIPRILHRTVPAETAAEAEQFWAKAVALHPGWEHHTWRDPLDPAEFPITSPHWWRCMTGAQLAGLVRLEVLWNHGGIYIDSDVELNGAAIGTAIGEAADVGSWVTFAIQVVAAALLVSLFGAANRR